MKKLFVSLALLAMAALAIGQNSAQPPKDLSGFSGYSWGAGIEFISHHMADEDYILVSASCTKLEYHGKILKEPLTLVYGFENGRLSSGIWVFGDVDYDSFWSVNEFLQATYNVKVEPTLKPGYAEAEMFPRGTNAHIVHNLDIEDDRHEVHYYFRSGAE